MQIYKLFGSLQYKVVKISHILGNFFYPADFTYINYTKKTVSKSQQPKAKGSVALICYASKISAQKKIPYKNILPHQNLLPRKLYKKRNFKACED